MDERYEPASDFLKAVAAEEVPLSGSPMGEANFEKLIAMMRDGDRSNRDWATLLVSQQDVDTPQVRAALLIAVQDEDLAVRAEALLGIAQRDKKMALPYAITALSGEEACMAVFEAAELIADGALSDLLRFWTDRSDNSLLDDLAQDALTACERGFSQFDDRDDVEGNQ